MATQSKAVKNRKKLKETDLGRNQTWEDFSDPVYQWILLSVVVLLPLLIRIHIGLFAAPLFTFPAHATGPQGDAFAYFKFCLLMILAGTSLTLLVVRILFFSFTIGKNYLNIPVLLFSLLLLLSLLAADYKGISLFGLYDRREGILTYLGYMALLFCFGHLSFSHILFDRIVKGLSLLVVLNALVSFSYYVLHFDLGSVGWIQWLIKPEGMPGTARISLPTLLENVNYSSGFNAAACVFFLAVGLLTPDRRRKIFPMVISAVAFFSIVASVSMSGIITILTAIPVVACLALFRYPKWQIIRGILASGAIFLCVFIATTIINETTWDEIVSFSNALRISPPSATPESKPATKPIEKAKTPPAEKRTEPTGQPPLPPELKNFSLKPLPEFEMPARPSGIDPVRTYIWRSLIPLIKQRPFLGYGLDTVPFYLNHYTKERYAILTLEEYITKPHNFFLTMAFGVGIPALLAILYLFGAHFLITCRKILLAIPTELTLYQLSLLGFFLSYLVQWLVNDSTLVCSSMFWALLGVAASLNQKVQLPPVAISSPDGKGGSL